MKKNLFIFLSLLCTGTALAQNDAYEMTIEGVKVIVQPSGNDIVEVQTIIKGGVMNYPAAKAGVESLAMTALTECGTEKHDKNSFKNALDKVSAQVYGYAGKDYSVLRMNCVKSDFATVWPLYAEAVTQPKFDPKEFARIKDNALSQLKGMESQPDYAVNKYADKVAFAGRNYAKDPSGTTETVTPLTVDEAKKHYQSMLTRSRMLIVVVADMDKAAIQQRVKTMLGGIKPGAAFALKKESFKAYKNTFASMPRAIATNYLVGTTSGPQPGTPDFNAFNVAMRIFYDRHFLEVRTNNGLSYAPGAYFTNGATSVARFSVSTTEPDKYIAVFDKLIEQIKDKGFAADEVKNMKITYLTSFYYKQETNSAQASSFASNEVLHNNWKRSLTLANDVKSLTVEEVNNAFRKYISSISWVYLGDTKKVNPVLFTNGTIKRVNNPVSY